MKKAYAMATTAILCVATLAIVTQRRRAAQQARTAERARLLQRMGLEPEWDRARIARIRR